LLFFIRVFHIVTIFKSQLQIEDVVIVLIEIKISSVTSERLFLVIVLILAVYTIRYAILEALSISVYFTGFSVPYF
jgi:hypothetical protein